MNWNRSQGILVSLNGTSIMRAMLGFAFCIMTMFTLSGILTSLNPEYRISSSSVHSLTNNFSESSLIYLLGYENRYFLQGVPKEHTPPSYLRNILQSATNFNPDDPRSLLGGELPGFTLFDGELLVAGSGTDYTDIPMESAPPMDVLLAEREAAVQNVDKSNIKKPVPPINTTKGKKVVFIYHSHNRESFLPLIKGATSMNEAYHPEANITLVGQKLLEELEARGIGTSIDKTDFTSLLNEKGWVYGQSYDASRPVVQSAIAGNSTIEFLFDLHRDSVRKEKTLVTINGKEFARIFLVIGGKHAKYKQNYKLAEDLHHLLESKFPGISRGVRLANEKGTNGKYNQDLSENSLIIEFGGVDNDLEELYNSAEAVAEVFSQYYWNADRVNTSAQ